SMVSLVSISYAQRLLTPSTAACLPKTSCPRRPERLCTGFVEASIVRRPCPANQSAVAPAKTVLPTPPLPPKKMYFRPGCSATYCRIVFSTCPMVRKLLVLEVLSGLVHQSREVFDHRQTGDVPFQLWHRREHAVAEPLPNIAQISFLHLDSVAQIIGDLLLE